MLRINETLTVIIRLEALYVAGNFSVSTLPALLSENEAHRELVGEWQLSPVDGSRRVVPQSAKIRNGLRPALKARRRPFRYVVIPLIPDQK
ncbi:hypothetical protein GCM10017612_18090 [Novosphingobium resinovorum]|nr:hypothetical protein GCM10017612_18090 [Novosphingobium resinovorum]